MAKYLDETGLAHFWARVKSYVDNGGVNCPFPVGCVLQMTNGNDPNTLYPGTTWTAINGAFLFASDTNHALGDTGGAETVALTTSQIPSHSHGSGTMRSLAWTGYTRSGIVTASSASIDRTNPGSGSKFGAVTWTIATSSTGGGAAHENMPPYKVVNVWERTA